MTPIAQGHYARKQLASRAAVIRWSHTARFRRAVRIASGQPEGKLLDCGYGDGTFIGLVADRFKACVGADITPDQVDDCRQRFAELPNVRFCLVQELAGSRAHA